MENTPNVIIEKIIKRFPAFRESFNNCEVNSTEVVLFGSYAYGCEHFESDVDVLFLGNKKRKASKYFDFIWLKPERINSKTWLSSELAIHIANYGVWLKGDGTWRNQVFFSQAAITRKKHRIFQRLTHIYLQKESLSFPKKKLFIQKIILNTLRLQNLINKIPNPPTCVMLNKLQDPSGFCQEIFKPHLLSRLGRVFLEEIFQQHEVEKVLYSTLNDLMEFYKAI
jgi:predicted nucleotidyltransferase